MKQCNHCNRRSCLINEKLGRLPKIKDGHCRDTPKSVPVWGWDGDCPMHQAPPEFRVPMIYSLVTNNAQGLHDSLQAMGLQIDPAYNRRGYKVVEVW